MWYNTNIEKKQNKLPEGKMLKEPEASLSRPRDRAMVLFHEISVQGGRRSTSARASFCKVPQMSEGAVRVLQSGKSGASPMDVSEIQQGFPKLASHR